MDPRGPRALLECIRVGCAVGLACALACGDGDERDPTSTNASATAPTGITTPDDSGTAGDDTADDDDDDSDPTDDKLDVFGGDAGNTGGDTSSTGCKKVDLLFVIDNSGSMADEQYNLITSFPDFIDGMRTRLSETDGYNVGVISTDVYTGDLTCLPLQEGALVTETAGGGSSNATCAPYTSGLRFMTEADDLESKFACAAQIGISGDGDERPVQATLAAFAPGITAPGACNEGFLRDDALLVVVMITDEEDDHEGEAEACDQSPQQGSAGEPAEWFDALVAIKGEETSIVLLSLLGPTGVDACLALDKCNGGIDGAEPAPRLLELTDMFTYGFVGPVCQPYGPFFLEAIDVIQSACDEFEPPG
jgi:hypothetical protein